MDPLPDDPTVKRRFDRAVAYFNAGRYFEAHEDWETLWHEAHGAHRLWLQGLIQVAAAFVHYSRGFHARGFAVLLREARGKLAGYAGPTHRLRCDRLEADLAPWFAHARRVEDGAGLRDGAPEPEPRLHMEAGYAPDPLPLAPPDLG